VHFSRARAGRMLRCLGDVVEKICSRDDLEEIPPEKPPAPTSVSQDSGHSDAKVVEFTAREAAVQVSDRRSQTKNPANSRKRTPAPVPVPVREDPASRPFFTGRWPGTRNDYSGEAGFRFFAEVDFEVTALGRPAEPPLIEAAFVTLWDADRQEALCSLPVGPWSRVEGEYAWEALPEPVPLQSGKEYRVTLRCRAGMPDRWCDSKAETDQFAAQSWASLARFAGGVCKNTSGFPTRVDGDSRRPGIANFKALLQPSSQPALTVVSRESLAAHLANSAVRSVELNGGNQQQVEARLAALAGLLAVIDDELAQATVEPQASAMALLAPEDELRRIASSAVERSSLALAGTGIFDSACVVEQMSRAAWEDSTRHCGLLLVGARTGEILGLCPRPRASGSGSVFGEQSVRPLLAFELLGMVSDGVAFARTSNGQVLAFRSEDVRAGQPFQGFKVLPSTRRLSGFDDSTAVAGEDDPETSWSVQL